MVTQARELTIKEPGVGSHFKEDPPPPWIGEPEIRGIFSEQEEPQIDRRVVVSEESYQATPRIFNVGTLLDDRLRLRTPIKVEIEQEGEFYIAKSEYLDEFGYGHSPMEAVDDLRLALAELYWALQQEEQNKLGQYLSELRLRLSQVIEIR